MSSLISRTRRNHGLEHATLNLLAKTHPGKPFAGHSDTGGFWILGEIPTDDLDQTITDALEKLRSGQSSLAIHQNCGTNLLVSGFASGLAGAAGLIGVGKRPRDKFERIPVITALSVLALIVSRPLGPIIQKNLTTSGTPGALKVVSITKQSLNGISAHRVKTQD